MSEVKRYKVEELNCCFDADMIESPTGDYVEYIDYARLKAEVERLTAMADENAHLHKGIYSLSLNVVQLKDEVERLRKAGDWMCDLLRFDFVTKEWNAAKEGKDK